MPDILLACSEAVAYREVADCCWHRWIGVGFRG